MPERRQWISLHAYAELYDVDPRTVRKWATAGLVDLVTVSCPPHIRTTIRVKNQPPRQKHVNTSQTASHDIS